MTVTWCPAAAREATVSARYTPLPVLSGFWAEMQRMRMKVLSRSGERWVRERRGVRYGQAMSRNALKASSQSRCEFMAPKLNRTAPCCCVPSAVCMSGAQCAPGRVAMP